MDTLILIEMIILILITTYLFHLEADEVLDSYGRGMWEGYPHLSWTTLDSEGRNQQKKIIVNFFILLLYQIQPFSHMVFK